MVSTFHLESDLVKLICLTKRYQIVNNSIIHPFKHILPKGVLSTSPYSVNCCKREVLAVVAAEVGCSCISRSAGTLVPSVDSSDGEEGSSGAAENRPTKVIFMQALDWVSHLLVDVVCTPNGVLFTCCSVDCCKRHDSVVVAAELGWILSATWGLSADDTDGGEEGRTAAKEARSNRT